MIYDVLPAVLPQVRSVVPSPSASQDLAAFASRPELRFPPLARSRAADAIVDCVGCVLAGLAEPVADVLSRVIAVGAPGARLAGSSGSASPMDAALFHGALAHAIDYDDTNHPAYAHPSAVLVPALLAVADEAHASGAELVTAYIVGFQVFGKLGRVLNFAHYQRGWHATGTFGALAASVAVGRLLRLGADQLTAAVGIAASSASGLRVNFGSMVKPLHAGLAARNGVLAALLARNGMDSSVGALDDQYGFFDVFNDGIGQDRASLGDWATPLEILTVNGLALKPFPACGATHTAIEAAIDLHERVDATTIDRAVVRVTRRAFAPLIHALPATPLEAKFSMQFCVAAALCDGRVDLATFSHEKLDDPLIRSMRERVTVVEDESLPDATEFPASVEIATRDGRSHSQMVPLAMGKPGRWFSEQQLRDKFVTCARQVMSATDADSMFRSIRHVDQSRPVSELFQPLWDADARKSAAAKPASDQRRAARGCAD